MTVPRPALADMIVALSAEVRYLTGETRRHVLRAVEILETLDNAGPRGRAYVGAALKRPHLHNEECFAIIKTICEIERGIFSESRRNALTAACATISICFQDLRGLEALNAPVRTQRRRAA